MRESLSAREYGGELFKYKMGLDTDIEIYMRKHKKKKNVLTWSIMELDLDASLSLSFSRSLALWVDLGADFWPSLFCWSVPKGVDAPSKISPNTAHVK